MKKYRALFLDMDGTFLDFHAAEEEAFYRALQKAGAEPARELYRAYSAINDGLWKSFEKGEITKQEIRDRRFTKLFEKYGMKADGIAVEKDYEVFLGEGRALIPHAKEVLAYLAGRYFLYVVTNGFGAVQKNRLRLSGIATYMTQVFISEELGFQKPQKEFFDICFQKMKQKIPCSEILLIGDSLSSDIQGARNAGLDSCWFNPDRMINESAVRPDYEIRTLRELTQML